MESRLEVCCWTDEETFVLLYLDVRFIFFMKILAVIAR